MGEEVGRSISNVAFVPCDAVLSHLDVIDAVDFDDRATEIAQRAGHVAEEIGAEW